MLNCLPFLVGLIMYSGVIIFHLSDLIRRRTVSDNCTDQMTQSLQTKSNICGVISSVVFISIIYFLCKYKHEKIAWGVILIPIVMVVILYLTILFKIQSLGVQDLNNVIVRD